MQQDKEVIAINILFLITSLIFLLLFFLLFYQKKKANSKKITKLKRNLVTLKEVGIYTKNVCCDIPFTCCQRNRALVSLDRPLPFHSVHIIRCIDCYCCFVSLLTWSGHHSNHTHSNMCGSSYGKNCNAR